TSAMVESFDMYGNVTSMVDFRGAEKILELDIPKGSLKRTITIYRESGENRRLITNYTSDAIGRITEIIGPSHPAVVPGATSEQIVRAVVWKLYKDVSGEVWTT